MRTMAPSNLVRRGKRSFRVEFVAGAVAAVVLCGSPGEARADEELLIKRPGDHPLSRLELEPHGLLGFSGPYRDFGGGFGVGVRANITLVQNGFVPQINNSVALGLGMDFLPYRGGRVFVPVVMQWNFWLSTHWSVFGEPGIGISSRGVDFVHPVFFVGGRYNFTERIALTMRLGYPAASVGASFFF
jgi:hypothetical protein